MDLICTTSLWSAADAMTPEDKEKIRELGDIAFLLCGKVTEVRSRNERLKDVLKEMQPFKDRIELLLAELGL